MAEVVASTVIAYKLVKEHMITCNPTNSQFTTQSETKRTNRVQVALIRKGRVNTFYGFYVHPGQIHSPCTRTSNTVWIRLRASNLGSIIATELLLKSVAGI